jgi:hypothetical protein
MSAQATEWPEPQNAFEVAWLRLYRSLTPTEQRAALNAAQRLLDGQPLEENLIELGIDFGDSPEKAREDARKAIRKDTDWRELLD